MAKFKLSTDKCLLIRGGLVNLAAGEVDTDDEDLVAALNGALDVERLSSVKAKDKPAKPE